MRAATAGTARRRVWSGRALALHAGLALVLPVCAYASWWQVTRALSGNTLSWAYVFEWPAFAALSVWLWWVLLTGPRPAITPAPARTPAPAVTSGPVPPAAVGGGRARRAALLESRRAPLRWEPAVEPPGLPEYNSWLADLSAGQRAARPKAAHDAGPDRRCLT